MIDFEDVTRRLQEVGMGPEWLHSESVRAFVQDDALLCVQDLGHGDIVVRIIPPRKIA